MNHCTETKTICLSRLSPIHVVDPITNYPNPQLKGFNFNPIGGGNGFTTLSLVRFKSALIPPILIIITNMLTYHKSWGWFCWENLPSHAVLVERVNLLDPFGLSLKIQNIFPIDPFFCKQGFRSCFLSWEAQIENTRKHYLTLMCRFNLVAILFRNVFGWQPMASAFALVPSCYCLYIK